MTERKSGGAAWDESGMADRSIIRNFLTGGGYRLRPWEDDAFACDFVVGQQWFGRALPEPDRCNQFYDLKDGERPDARL